MFRNLTRRIAASIVSTDPEPEYSRLDQMDGRGTTDIAGAKHDGFMRALAEIDGGAFNHVETGYPAPVVRVAR